MEKTIFSFMETMVHNTFFQAVALAIVFDTLMGLLRSLKEKKFNSCFGINGAIRKVAMVICILFLGLADNIIGLNLIGFIPKDLWKLIGMQTPAVIGLKEFFAILFIVYEIVSILKNMTMAGLPVKGLWMKVKVFLSKYTSELPDDD
ncbi:MAG: phage holin family protein [Lachnospiraceae bacterium]|nr:phage holin family protein [Lachnospiraceae bacterium]